MKSGFVKTCPALAGMIGLAVLGVTATLWAVTHQFVAGNTAILLATELCFVASLQELLLQRYAGASLFGDLL